MASPTNLTPADVIAIKAMRVPGWVDRSKMTAEDVVDPATGKTERTYSIGQPLPQHLQRKDMKRILALTKIEHRLRRVEKGAPIEIVGGLRPDGSTERIFVKIIKAGSFIVRVHRDRRDGRKHICLAGTAKFTLDRELGFAFDSQFWRDDK